jgi:uncharacterized protein involved in cysteine biosynthesis
MSSAGPTPRPPVRVTVLGAALRAAAQLVEPEVARLLGVCVLLALACFAAVWVAVGWLLASTAVTDIGWLEGGIDVLGGLATLVLTWFLFPVLTSGLVTLFLERIAAAVEARHHPQLGRAPGVPFATGLWCTLRALTLLLGANLLLLVLWLFPPAYAIAYYAVNGLLLGREYFELVALRRDGFDAARALRRRHRGELFALGLLGAFVATFPIGNLVAPVLLTIAMVHLHVAWRAR